MGHGMSDVPLIPIIICIVVLLLIVGIGVHFLIKGAMKRGKEMDRFDDGEEKGMENDR